MSNRKFLLNTAMSLVSQIIAMISSFVIPRLIIGTYGSALNGITNSISQFVALIIILEFGVSSVIQSILYKPILDNNHQEIIRILNYTKKIYKKITIILVIYVILLGIFIPYMIDIEQISRLDIFFLTIILGGIQLFQNYLVMPYIIFLTANQKAYVFLIVQSLVVILQTIFIAFAVALSLDIIQLKLLTITILSIKPVAIYLYVIQKYRHLISKYDSSVYVPNVWYGGTQHITAVVLENTDVIVLSIFSTTSNVSIYSVYFLVVQGIRKLITIFSNGIIPYFGSLYAEKKFTQLKEKFFSFELLMSFLMVVSYTSAVRLIIPFIRNYLSGVEDVNYEIPIFGIFMGLAQASYIIRYIYYTLVTAAGKFKETRTSSIIEASINIVISVIAVSKFGLVGVAFGTFIAMLYRGIHLSFYCSKNILTRKNSVFYKVFVFDVISFSIVMYILNNLVLNTTGFVNWGISGLIVVTISTITTGIIFTLFYPKKVKLFYGFIKQYFNRRRV